jgi:hypothetical protein
VIRIRDLIPLAHDYPPALLVAEIKFRHGSGFGCLLIRRFNGPEILPALPDDRHAPASQLGGGGPLSRALHVDRHFLSYRAARTAAEPSAGAARFHLSLPNNFHVGRTGALVFTLAIARSECHGELSSTAGFSRAG